MAKAANKPHPSELPAERRRQTENKLDVLGAYFAGWPNAIIRGLKKRGAAPTRTAFWIIDLFAGRGWHESETWAEGRRPGTPAMAGFRLWQAQNAVSGLNLESHLVAIDADPAFEAPLHATLDRYSKSSGGIVDVRIDAKNCAQVIPELRKETRRAFSLWLFDPYGLDSIPFCLFEPLFDGLPNTEVLINLDAGAMVRVIDAQISVQGSTDLSTLKLKAMDCLFGDQSWRELPGSLTGTGDRERWLIDKYMSRFTPHFLFRAAHPLEGSRYVRFIVQLARSQTAIDVFKAKHREVTKPLKMQGPKPKRKDLARVLSKDFAGQTLTPREILALGYFGSSVSLDEVTSICDHAFDLGLAERSPGPDSPTKFGPVAAPPQGRLPM